MIRLSRQSTYEDKFRNYEIIVDGIHYGDIGDGETKEIDIQHGKHSISLKIDWCRSNELIFVESENRLIEFQCGNSMQGLKKLLILMYISILKNKYLFINIKESIL